LKQTSCTSNKDLIAMMKDLHMCLNIPDNDVTMKRRCSN